MNKLTSILAVSLLAACTHKPAEQPLPVLNLAQESYPERTIDIREIADVEYIPLETTDSSLVGGFMNYYHISDKYIVTSDRKSGSVLVFDRNGKFRSRFCHLGKGPNEYAAFSLLFVDFANEECFIHDYTKEAMMVYSLEGKYLRTFPFAQTDKEAMKKGDLSSFISFQNLYLCDNESFIGKNTVDQTTGDRRLYYLIGKNDGIPRPLGLNFSKKLIDMKNSPMRVLIGNYHPLLQNGKECLIADLNTDTLYTYSDRNLKPVAVKSPSAKPGQTNTVMIPQGYTDNYLVFFKAEMPDFSKATRGTRIDGIKPLVWNRKTNEIENLKIYDDEFSPEEFMYLPPQEKHTFTKPNWGLVQYSASDLIESREKGTLKGELKEIASKLHNEEDNNVLVLVQYK